VKTFEELWRELGEIARTRPAGSNTSELLAGGVHSIGKKIVEEAAEVWMAAEYESDEDLALEISQLIYYLQVMMLAREIEMDAVYQEL
jgi:phosphoribosyl-ATP pyrophosphohydrolase